MTMTELEWLKSIGKIRGYRIVNEPKKTKQSPKAEPKGLAFIKTLLNTMNVAYEVEYKFLKNRKFRFDIAMPQYMLFVEYEGMVASGRGGHQTMSGYTKNCEKYNLAAVEGWSGLRYTTMNYKSFEQNIIDFLLKFQ